MGGIYEIVQNSTDAFYLGSSIKPACRWKRHRELLRRNAHTNHKLQAAWNKYGESAFSWKVIEVVCDDSQLLVREDFYLHRLKPRFNLTFTAVGGAMRGRKHSAISRVRMTLGQYRYWRRRRLQGKGRLTEQHKSKIAAAHVGIRPPLATREKMSASAKRRGSTWGKWSPSAKARFLRMARSQKGRKKSRAHVRALKRAHETCNCPRHVKARLRGG